MAKFTPITLTGTVSSMVGSLLYGETDGTGLQSEYKTYNVVLSNISTQSHADASTREPLLYNGLDITAGMFIADDSGNTILKVTAISAKSETSITCICEDIDMLSFRLNNTNTISLGGSVVLFDLNPEGEPIIAGSPFLAGAIDKVQSRFNLNEKDDRVKFIHSVKPIIEIGDIATIDENGNIVKYGTPGSSETKVGIVLDKLRNGKDIYIKPFNDIIRNFADPEALTGQASDIYYTDESIAGAITTTEGGKASFLQLNDAIATTQSITSVTQPGSNDIITINNFTIFDGPNGDTVADATAFSSLINTFTGDTNVSSAITQAPGTLDSESNSILYTGSWGDNDIFIPLYADGANPPQTFPAITISDGNNTSPVTFDTADSVAIGYNVISPAGIASAIQAAVTAGNLDIIVETYTSTTHNGSAVRLTSTGAATGIQITNTAADPFGGNVAGSGSSTGLGLNATLGAPTLTLTRNSGGAIEIDGTPLSGGYLNQSGAVSSNSGRVPYLLLIESEGGATVDDIDGVHVIIDQDKTPNVTSGNYSTTGIKITFTPWNDSNIEIKVNGIGCNLGNGIKTKDCYFSNDGGTTARLIKDIEADDTLYWNSIIAGYILDSADEIDIDYEAASNIIENYVAPSPSPSPTPLTPAPAPKGGGVPSPTAPSPTPTPTPSPLTPAPSPSSGNGGSPGSSPSPVAPAPSAPSTPSPTPAPTPAPSPGSAPSPGIIQG